MWFRSVPFQCVRWFRFGFSHKPKTRRLDRRPLFFFSRPRPNVSRLRWPGAVRAQPSVTRACAAATRLKLSRRNGPRRHWIDFNWVPVDLSICLHLSEWHICIFCPTPIVVSTLRVSTTKNGRNLMENNQYNQSFPRNIPLYKGSPSDTWSRGSRISASSVAQNSFKTVNSPSVFCTSSGALRRMGKC